MKDRIKSYIDHGHNYKVVLEGKEIEIIIWYQPEQFLNFYNNIL